MTNATLTATDTVATTTQTTVAPAVPKEPSKKSKANAIFAAKLIERSQGLFASNKEFRAAVLSTIQADLGVSTASAATMYNAAKKDAETADAAVALGRDPKKEKAPSTGKRGRPSGSKNKAKEVIPVANVAVVVTDDTADADTSVEAAPAEAIA